MHQDRNTKRRARHNAIRGANAFGIAPHKNISSVYPPRRVVCFLGATASPSEIDTHIHHAASRVADFSSEGRQPPSTRRSTDDDRDAGSCTSCRQNRCVPQSRCRRRCETTGRWRAGVQSPEASADAGRRRWPRNGGNLRKGQAWRRRHPGPRPRAPAREGGGGSWRGRGRLGGARGPDERAGRGQRHKSGAKDEGLDRGQQVELRGHRGFGELSRNARGLPEGLGHVLRGGERGEHRGVSRGGGEAAGWAAFPQGGATSRVPAIRADGVDWMSLYKTMDSSFVVQKGWRGT